MVDIDEFVSHGTRGSSAGRFLSSDWKKIGALKIWLHMARGFPIVWFHDWYKMVPKHDGTGMMLWRDRFNCHENYDTLEDLAKRYRFRNGDIAPPALCPMCRAIECVHVMVESGKLHWLEPVFEFQGDRDKFIYNAAAIYGGIRESVKDPLSIEQKEQLARAHVSVKESYKMDLQPVEHYLFTLVSKPSEGIKLSFEKAARRGSGIGTKMNRVVRERMEVSTRELGNPTANPYPFLWKYNKSEEDAKNKYNVIAIPEEKPTDEILALIRDTPPPEYEDLVQPGNCLDLELSMRAAAKIDLPWDEIFGPAHERGLMKESRKPKDSKSTSAQVPTPKEEAKAAPKPAPTAEASKLAADVKAIGQAAVDKATEMAAAAEGAMYECDACSAPIGQFDFECKKCGAIYDSDGGLASRPCPKCKKAVDVTTASKNDAGERRCICGGCSTILDADTFAIVKEGRLPSRSSARQAKDDIPFR